ncbi:MAG TPA: family 43 glycosylhydrolase, partial [Chitinophagaceae bacterium]|nr:family 43 glycosylhydrolase [Chitinophagaceae bacterium]
MYCNYQILLGKNRLETHDGPCAHPSYRLTIGLVVFTFFTSTIQVIAQQQRASNPVIFADVPDMSMIRVNDTYYMSSTTMHLSPGVPIMKSKDLVNWQIVNYVYDTLADIDELNLENGKNTYGRGSWASCLR